MRILELSATLAFALAPAAAQNASVPGQLIEEAATLRCLGVRWLIGGDANANATVAVEYRRAGTTAWRRALPLFRVERAGMRTPPPNGEVVHAGSVFDLAQATDYEVRLSLNDPDGGSTQRVVKMRTWSEVPRPAGLRTVSVKPGELAKALASSQPGDVMELQPGTYRGSFAPVSGTATNPITIVGPADRSAVLDGGGGSSVLNRVGLHHVIFENLTIQNATYGMAFNEGAHLTVRRCTIRDVEHGFVAQRNGIKQQRILITDNVMTGRTTWPRSHGIESRRGVQIGGTGHVVCFNRISHFADAIDVPPAYPTTAIDIYGNEISECTDDGIEMDYSEHNTRCFDNRLTNVYQGISLQPVHGGPVYVFRNTMYNVVGSPFKLHNGPSGGLIYHNTSVKAGMPATLYGGATISNTHTRNNLFIGTTGNYALESTTPTVNCHFDFDGFGGTWTLFLKWNGVRYSTMAQAKTSAPVYKNAVRVDPSVVFGSGLKAPAKSDTQFAIGIHDTRLSSKNSAIDAGVPLANINDGFAGKAPDLGAFELGTKLPAYGPRPVRAINSTNDKSPKPGGKVKFVLTTEAHGGVPYQMASSFGTGPLVIDMRRLELAPDGLFALSISGLFPTLFTGFAGVLSATGRATATFAIPMIPALAGLSIHSAFVTLDPSAPSGIRSISNTVTFRIVSG